MIQSFTRLNVADNSGAEEIMCIKVLGGSHRRYATVGDVIVASVKKPLQMERSKKGRLLKQPLCEQKKRFKEKMDLLCVLMITLL